MRISPTLPAVQAVLQEGRLGIVGTPVGERSALGQRALQAVKDLGGAGADRDGQEPPPEFLSDHRKSPKKQAKSQTKDEMPEVRPSQGPVDESVSSKQEKFSKVRALAMRQLGAKAEATPIHKKKHLAVTRAYSQNHSLEADSTGQQIDRYV